MTTIIRDTDTGFFPTVDEVFDRFLASATDAEVPFSVASTVFEDACTGDRAARELVEETCGVEFL